MLSSLKRAWQWFTDDHVIGTTPGVARHFMRCESCSRIFRHYWGCLEVGEVGRVGCPCGAIRARITRLPEWKAAAILATCYVWRRLIQRKRYWDPRMPSRLQHLDA